MSTATQKQIVIVQVPKNPAAALLLGLFFGPIGLLYAGRIVPAIVMFVIGGIIGFVTLGMGLFLIWPICAIWSYSAAKAYNKKLMGDAA